MKNWLFLFLVTTVFQTQAQNIHRLSSKLETVTVYEQGANFERSATVNLAQGSQKIVFNNLPLGIDPNSIQIGSNKKLELLSIQNSVTPEEDRSKPVRLLELEKEIEQLEQQKEEVLAHQEALRLENEFLAKNTSLGGNQGYSLIELREISQYAKEQKLKNQLQQQAKKREMQSIQEKLVELQKEAGQLRYKMNRLSGEIIVKLNNPQNQNCKFHLAYTLRNGVSWVSSYNLYFENLGQDLKLNHKAKIYQNSGEDWEQVKLQLVTGTPNQNTQMPIVLPGFVNFQSQFLGQRRDNYFDGAAKAESLNEVVVEYKAPLVGKDFNLVTQQTRTEFLAPNRYSIANETNESISLRDLRLTANFEYQASPALDAAAYLVAIVKDWEKLQLLNGEMSLYNQGLYIGSNYMNFNQAADSIMISLGKDPSINIKHERVFSKESKSFLGSDRIDEYRYELTLLNRKSNDLKIRVYDRVPISQNEDIRIKHQIGQNGKIPNPETGVIEWTLNLQPGKSKTLEFGYEIRYPKDQQINW